MPTSYPTTVSQQLHALYLALHLSHTPEVMPCRDDQQSKIRSFLVHHVNGRLGGSMYVSGSPGTGKTSSIDHVIYQMYGVRILDSIPDTNTTAATSSSSSSSVTNSSPSSSGRKVASKLLSRLNASSAQPRTPSLTQPRIIYLNAMTFSRQPRSLYPKLLSQIKSLTPDEEAAIAPMDALEQLKGIFCPVATSKKANESPMTLVVLDEVDALLSGSSPAVLYSLLEWPLTLGSRLVVIAISNSINLLEQKLPHLVARNALPTNLVFATYSKEELRQIVQDRCDSIYPPEREPTKLTNQSNAKKITNADDNDRAAKLQSPIKTKTKDTTSVSSSPPPSATKSTSSSSSSAAPSSSPVKGTYTIPGRGGRWKETMEAAPLLLASDRRMSRSQLAAAVKSSPSSLINQSHMIGSASSIAQLATGPRGKKRKQSETSQTSAQKKQEDAEIKTECEPSQLPTSTDAPSDSSPAESAVDAEACDAVPDLLVTPKKKSKLSLNASPSSSSSSSSVTLSPFAPSPCPDSALAPLSTRSTPFFDPFALDLLCAKVAKGSGDLRKVLEVARKAVDALTVELESRRILQRDRLATRATPASSHPPQSSPVSSNDDRSDGAPSPFDAPTSDDHAHAPLQVSVGMLHSLMMGALGSASDQSALLRSLPVQQKVVLIIAVLLGHMQGSKDVLGGFAQHHARFARKFDLPPLTGHELGDLLAALAAHGLIKIVPQGRKRLPTGSGASGGGSGTGMKSRKPGSGSGSSHASQLGSIQVNVTLESVTIAFEEDEAMHRLITKGKAVAAAFIAETKASSKKAKESSNDSSLLLDHDMRDIEE